MDAPTIETIVHKSNGSDLVVAKYQECFDAEMDTAVEINRVLGGLFALERLVK